MHSEKKDPTAMNLRRTRDRVIGTLTTLPGHFGTRLRWNHRVLILGGRHTGTAVLHVWVGAVSIHGIT